MFNVIDLKDASLPNWKYGFRDIGGNF